MVVGSSPVSVTVVDAFEKSRMEKQKLKHGGKYLKITKDVKLSKANISV